MQKLLANFKANKVLWLAGLGIVLTLVAVTVVILVMAGGDTPSKPSEPDKDPIVDDTDTASTLTIAESELYQLKKEDKHYTLTVENDTSILYLYQYVQVKEGVEWLLSTDVEATGETTIASKTVGPEAGENTYYILCTDDKGLFEIYTVTVYRKQMFNVSFENLSQSIQVQEGDMAGMPEDKPKKDGYTFVSWNFNFTTPITEDVMVTANWKANTYTITYDPNGGSLATQTQIVTFGSDVKLAVPSRNGYDFAGWQKGDKIYTDGVWDTAENVHLTAIWDYSAFTVMLDAAGGKLSENSVKVRYGTSYQLPTPEREGFVFLGWYNGDELIENEGTWNRLAGLSLLAKWNVSEAGSISCTMIANGGTILPQTQQLPVGAKLPIPQRAGYTFGGWFADVDLTVPVTEITQELLDSYGASIRVYAWWQEEGKPGQFRYELSGIYCVVIGYTTEEEDKPTIPAYIGGREVKVNIKPPINPNAGITVSPELNLTVGDASVIFATFIPAYIEDSTKLYFTTESDCIMLGENGSFTALKPGVAVVNIRNEDGKYTATCTLTIVGKPNANPGITVVMPEIEIEEGKQMQAGVIFVPERQGDSTDLVFTVDSDCVKVENGVIIAIEPGFATITVKNLDGKYQAEIRVTVTARVANPNAGITPEQSQITLMETQSGRIHATVIPAFPEDSTELHFATESDCIELNADGSFTAVKAGVATVSVSTSAGLTANVQITVTPFENENPGITPENSEITLTEGENGRINATVVPKYTNDSVELTFTTESDCIELNADGSFTAVKAGVAVVTLTTPAGLSANVTVTVEPAENENPGITPEQTEITLTEGENGKINATVVPKYTNDSVELTFTTESDCIELNADGSFTAVKAGVAVVTLTTPAGLSANVTVTVEAAEDSEPDPEPDPEPEQDPEQSAEPEQGTEVTE